MVLRKNTADFKEWFYKDNQYHERGPFSAEEMKTFLSSGNIDDHTPVKSGQMTGYLSLKNTYIYECLTNEASFEDYFYDFVSTNTISLRQCAVLGGAGYAFSPGENVNLRFGPETLVIQSVDSNESANIPFLEVVDLTIGGPGSVTTGGGFIGGGFGVEGALEGMAIGAILNLLTTQAKITLSYP